MHVLCSILVAMSAHGINILMKVPVQGRVIYSVNQEYVVDFAKDLYNYSDLAGKPSDYRRVHVAKSECATISH